MSVKELENRGLLKIGCNSQIYNGVTFLPSDYLGNIRPIIIGDRVRIMPGAIIYGGSSIDNDSVIESQVILGQPEYGYAIGNVYHGEGKDTKIYPEVILRAGAILYAGVEIGESSSIGHRTLIRSEVSIGNHTQLGHNMVIERGCKIGSWVRCTGLTHITSYTVIEDRVFLGALIGTVNDKDMIWQKEGFTPELIPPYFEYGCCIGTGAKISSGVRIGKESLVGTGSVVTKDVLPRTVVLGVPARLLRVREDIGNDP